jgi:hypothetical protein
MMKFSLPVDKNMIPFASGAMSSQVQASPAWRLRSFVSFRATGSSALAILLEIALQTWTSAAQ